MSIKNRVIEYKNLLSWGFKHDIVHLLLSVIMGIIVLISWSPLVPALFMIPAMSGMDIIWVLLGNVVLGAGGTAFAWFMFKAFVLDTIRIDKYDAEVAAERERIEAEGVRIREQIRQEQEARAQAAADRYTQKLIELSKF